MGFSPDDVLVEDCGVVPGWIHRNLEILRQLDCRASIFDHEVRRAMLEMIKISSSNKSAVTSSIFRKRGKIIDAKSDTQDFNNNDTLRFSSCDEPPTKRRRCDQLSIESFHQLGKFHTDTSTTDDSTEMSTTPDSSSLSPSLSPQIHISQHPVHHKLRRQTPSRVSPSTSTHCSDATSSPDSFVSSSPLTPNDHLPSEEPLPASQHQPFDTSSQQPECAPCLTSELPLIDPHRVNQTPFGLEASISSTLEDCSNGSEPPAALSAARYLLGRKRALLVQKLSLLRQGSLVVKQEHARLIQRHNSTTQQQGTTNVSGTTTPAESSCSASTRRLRSSTHAHHHNFGAVSTRAATTAHSTRFQAQQQTSQLVADAPVEVKPEPDKRRTRTGSINSSSGSNSGASTLTRLRNRKSTILSSASTASSSASLPHQVSLQPDKLDRSASRQTPDRFPVAHRSHPPTPKRQPSSTPLESPDVSSRHHSALSSTIEGSATTPTNLSQSTSQHVNPTQSSLVTVNSSTVQSPSPQTAAAVKPSSHTVSYEPLNPSTSATISSSSPPTDSNTETAKATINGEFGNQSANASFRRNVDTASAHTASTSTFFDAHNHSSHHYPNNVPPPHMGNDPLSFLAAAYSSHPLSHSHLLQRPFGLYDHTAPPPIAYSTPGIVASQDPIQSLYSSDPSTLFHQQHRSDHQLIGISHPPSGVSQSTPPSSVTAPSKATNSIKSSKRSSHHSDRTNGHATPSSSSESASNHYSFISTNSPSGYPLHPQPAVSQQLQHSSNYNTKSHRDPFGGQTFITPSTNQNTSINNEQQQSEHRNDVICNSNNAASITKGIAAPTLPSLGLPLSTHSVVSSASPTTSTPNSQIHQQPAPTVTTTKQSKSKKSDKASSTVTNINIVMPIVPPLQPPLIGEPLPLTETDTPLVVDTLPAVVGSDWSGKCPVCGQGESAYEGMVACDSCNDWFHFVCVGYEQKQQSAIIDLPPPPPIQPPTATKSKKSKKKNQQAVVELPPPSPEDDDNWYCEKCIAEGKVPTEELRKMMAQRRR